MKISSLSDFTGGWFIGNFSPTLHDSTDFEVAVKYYTAGEEDVTHLHKIATEWTVVVSGEVEMNGVGYKQGDIIEVQPNESSFFLAVTSAIITVVKIPSVKGDKYVL